MKDILIAPSILGADFKKLEQEIAEVEQAGANWLHFDVMDGHFVDNISFGIPVLKSIANCHHLINDVHIMIQNPLHFAKRFLDCGADYLTFHYEAATDDEILEIIKLVHSENKKVGISIKPNTSWEVLIPYLKYADLILVMSVEPGFGGQKFIDSVLHKINNLSQYREKHKDCHFLIEVDGGINNETSLKCIKAGVDVLVSGSFIFKSQNKASTIKSLKGE